MTHVDFKIILQDTPDQMAATDLLSQGMACINSFSAEINNQIQIAAFDANKIIAAGVLVNEGPCFKIQQIVVQKNMQNEGIGSQILKYLEDYAWLYEAQYIYSVPNDVAFLFFDKNGYKFEGDFFDENNVSFIKVKKSLQERYATDYFTKTTLCAVYRSIIEECPAYREQFLFLEKDLYYQIAANFADFIVEAYVQNKKEILKSFVRLIHNLIGHEDDKVGEFAVIGVLEAIQGDLSRAPEKYLEFSKMLTSQTRLWWNSLDKFWNKEIPYVGFDISASKR